MKTQTSKTKMWLSTMLLLPIIAILFYSFAEKEYVEKEYASEISDLKEGDLESNLFLVTVKKNNNTIELKCETGCQWSHLVLEPRNTPYIINDYGFSEGRTIDTDKFAFSIKPTDIGVELNGLNGTAWVDLTFSLRGNKTKVINQLGMTYKSKKKLKKAKKELKIKALNDELFINGSPINLDTYKDELNFIMKDWTDEDFKSFSPDLEISECSEAF